MFKVSYKAIPLTRPLLSTTSWLYTTAERSSLMCALKDYLMPNKEEKEQSSSGQAHSALNRALTAW